MTVELSQELKDKLRKAKSHEEIVELLKADGKDEKYADRIWKELEILNKSDGKEHSAEEMAAVKGGSSCSYWEEGCAATVEEGSDCWGRDGGCSFCNISYYDIPYDRCPRCSALCLCKMLYHAPGGVNSGNEITCRNCGTYIIGY